MEKAPHEGSHARLLCLLGSQADGENFNRRPYRTFQNMTPCLLELQVTVVVPGFPLEWL